jgi:phage gp29-like protein
MNKQGLFVNPTTFRAFQQPTPTVSLTGELATRQNAYFYYRNLWWLPNPDPVLKKTGKAIDCYRDLQSDGYVRGCIKGRKSGVLQMNRGLDRGQTKSRQAKIVDDMFKDLEMQRIISEILDAAQFGYAPLEIIWGKVGDWLLPVDIVGKPVEWFIYDANNILKFRSMEFPMGQDLPDRKFLCARQEATYFNPYGFPDLSCCFWPVAFKHGGMQFWVSFAEKWGQVFAIGKVPRGTDKVESGKLLDSLYEMIQDAAAVIPDDSSVELKESGGKAASSDMYKDLLVCCKQEISVVQLGHEAGVISTPGKLGGETEAALVRKDIVDADKFIVEQTLNTLIKYIWDLNFTGERPSYSLWENEDVDQTLATRDKSLSDQGVRFRPEYYAEAYNLKPEHFTVSAPEPGVGTPDPKPADVTAATFSETPVAQERTGQDAIDAAIGNLSDEDLQAQAEGMLRPVIDLVNKEKDLNAVLKKLASVYPEMNSDALQQMLERAVFVSEYLGASETE